MHTNASSSPRCVGGDPWSARRRVALREQLASRTPFSRGVTESLAQYAEFASIGPGGEICTSDQPTKTVRFVMAGVAKLALRVHGERDLIVRFFAPHRFVAVPPTDAGRGYRASVVAHDTTHVALLRYEDFQRAFGALGDRTATVHSWGFRRRMRELCDVAVFLRLGLVERLLHGLRHLAKELRDPARLGPGIGLVTRISRDDLADLCGASRPAVSRAMARLEAAGVVLPGPPMEVIIDDRVLSTNPRTLADAMRRKEAAA